MRRGKPAQEIYKPGSGKLRRSNHNFGEENSITENQLESSTPAASTVSATSSPPLADNGKVDTPPHGYNQNDDSRRKSEHNLSYAKNHAENQTLKKKPDRELYVPKPLQEQFNLNNSYPSFEYSLDLENDFYKTPNTANKAPKRYSNNRSIYNSSKTMNQNHPRRDRSPPANKMPESRTVNYNNKPNNYSDKHHHNQRDTRSVEPCQDYKYPSKPPSGRRNSTACNYDLEKRRSTLKFIENLPPRLQKKYLEKNGLTMEDINWDGGNSSTEPAPNLHRNHRPPEQTSFTLPYSHTYKNSNYHGYHTLPGPQRGRGRMIESDFVARDGAPPPPPGAGTYRSLTPDRSSSYRSPVSSRSTTPTRRYQNNKSSSRPSSRSQTPVRHHHQDSLPGASTNVGQQSGDRFNRSASMRDDRNDNRGMRRQPENQRKEDFKNRRNDFPKDKRDGYHNRSDVKDKQENYRRNDKSFRQRGGSDKHFHSNNNNVNNRGNNHRFESSEASNHKPTEKPKFQEPPAMRGQSQPSPQPAVTTTSPPPATPSVKQEPVVSPKNDATPLELNTSLTPVTPPVAEDAPVELEQTPAKNDISNILESSTTLLSWDEEVELSERLEKQNNERNKKCQNVQDGGGDRNKFRPGGGGRNKDSGRNYRDRTPTNHPRQRKESLASTDSRDGDNFRRPYNRPKGGRSRRSSRDYRDGSYDRYYNKSRGPSRDVSFDRNHSNNCQENWRDEMRKTTDKQVTTPETANTATIERDDRAQNAPVKKGGLIVLPQEQPASPAQQPSSADRPKYPDISRKIPAHSQKTLFDPNNPNRPILVNATGQRVAVPGFSDSNSDVSPPQMQITDEFGNLRPNWYDENREEFKRNQYPDLLRDIKRADADLQHIIHSGMLLVHYDNVDTLRQFLKSALEYLLCNLIKFCQTENVEYHFWKILYYNIIEVTRKSIITDPDNKSHYKAFLLSLIDEGTKYFESLVETLEKTFNFKVANFIGSNSTTHHKNLRYLGLALISTQKLFLFLGDLGRYREQVNETANYGKCRQWYIKALEINPKNGKPYNQLAVLAVYSKRKLDAVYYYMRSLMSSNPVPSAKENLISLFDEIRKKYEQDEKKRRDERLERQRLHMKEKETVSESSAPNYLRRETWIHPVGGRRLHRTTKALQGGDDDFEEEEDLASLTSVDVNKRFVISYLHVQGKLITKIGMESFQDAAMQMLKEFKALLQHSPVPLPSQRLLQLLALNMFAIETTQLKDPQIEHSNTNYRSEIQERALIVSLTMFNLILERCVSILQEHLTEISKENLDKSESPLDSLPADACLLLPSVKIWCDWMLCHTSIWNPPPSINEFKFENTSVDLWTRLGLLMNILERMEENVTDMFSNEPSEDNQLIRLTEDTFLCGFTPLMFNETEPAYATRDLSPQVLQTKLRVAKLLFFGTVYLCGLEPPVLKLEIEDGRRDYVSVVSNDMGRDSPKDDAILSRSDEVLLETLSGEEDEEDSNDTDNSKALVKSSLYDEASSEVKDLLSRKLELEERKKNQELHRQRVMKILSQSVVSVHLEIRPKYLVPDTNCFIDHLETIQNVTKGHSYTLMVPIVVLSELEGLSKGESCPRLRRPKSCDLDHIRKVAAASKNALEFLKKRHTAVKCVTTRGAVLASTTFSTEDDATMAMTNDDKILATCLVLCKNHGDEHQQQQPQQQSEPVAGEPRHLYRELVLLTEDRNLRVKAHSHNVPVRALPDFVRWAELR